MFEGALLPELANLGPEAPGAIDGDEDVVGLRGLLPKVARAEAREGLERCVAHVAHDRHIPDAPDPDPVRRVLQLTQKLRVVPAGCRRVQADLSPGRPGSQ